MIRLETIFPPIIDNTIQAFVADYNSCQVKFYFQNDTGINKDYVIVSIYRDGEDVINGCLLYRTQYAQSDIISSTQSKREYMVDIRQHQIGNNFRFEIDRPLSISLFTIAQDVNIANLQAMTPPELNHEVQSANNEKYSQASNPAIKIPIPKPTMNISIEQNNGNEVELSQSESYKDMTYFSSLKVLGNLTFNAATTDKISWYQLRLYDSTEPMYKVLEETGRQYPDRNTNSLSFEYLLKTSFINLSEEEKDKIKTLNLEVVYQTINGYIQSLSYNMILNPDTNRDNNENIIFDSLDDGGKVMQFAFAPNTGGYRVYIKPTIKNVEAAPSSLDGYLVLLRKNLRTGGSWEEIFEQSYTVIKNNSKIVTIEDVTVESGVPYNYKVDFYYYELQSDGDFKKVYSQNLATDEQIAIKVFDEIFLVTKELCLKVFLNAAVSGYKKNVVDNVVTTLGGAYPFIRRNGQQKYRSFTLEGLIAFDQELMETTESEEQNFSYILSNDSCERYNNLVTEQYNFIENSVFFNSAGKDKINTALYSGLSKQDQYMIYQKIFRDKVQDFLYSDQIVLYKSQQEGNIFVKLINVSLTPNRQLFRNVWNFTAQAIEVLPATSENYTKMFSIKADQEELSLRDIYLLTQPDTELNSTETVNGMDKGYVYLGLDELLLNGNDSNVIIYQDEIKI